MRVAVGASLWRRRLKRHEVGALEDIARKVDEWLGSPGSWRLATAANWPLTSEAIRLPTTKRSPLVVNVRNSEEFLLARLEDRIGYVVIACTLGGLPPGVTTEQTSLERAHRAHPGHALGAVLGTCTLGTCSGQELWARTSGTQSGHALRVRISDTHTHMHTRGARSHT